MTYSKNDWVGSTELGGQTEHERSLKSRTSLPLTYAGLLGSIYVPYPPVLNEVALALLLKYGPNPDDSVA